ncbi:ferric reductase-like transmembrane domain-containing protein [Alicyclobacillus tolerans]|uniref:ferric reductase-like transmembrane domain-containing protein n=1 Tax=Alicyclobacillus tolerans TaxID=90970 RepID=UPI001F3F3CD0|nr:ferric reductase-like transmembrane domain-containing protein [Alicyclobacillus tolerans]MCF8565415.1 ferric reductase-like transmembrane domain-containing protein [Alicyclobacillus tolerans]
MEFVEERQQGPFWVTYGAMFFIMVASYGLSRLLNPGQAAVNMFYWYMARSAGFTAYLLLSLTVVLGVSNTSAVWDRWKLRKLITQMHQYASLLVVPFIAFHLWGLYQDTTIQFHLASFLLPFHAAYRPFATTLGVLSLYGMVILIGSSYLMKRMGPKTWRSIHFLSFPTFVLVTLHGMLAGTDSGQRWALFIYLVPFTVFLILTSKRMRKVKVRA